MKRKVVAPEIRFWRWVNKSEPGGCWVWSGARREHGYGQFSVVAGTTPVRAHRFSWELVNGKIPAGMVVCHKCDNPPCVNPDHLFLGTKRDNTLDAMRKGRLKWPDVRGKNPNAKITASQALEIRSANGRHIDIARLYGISPSSVGQIKSGVQWKNL